MDANRANPTRKRRRRLFLALILLFASTGAWWYCPRGDARFVGKWQRVGGTANASELLLTSIDLHSNGTGRCIGTSPAETTEFVFPWRVEGGTLVIGRGRRGWASMLLDEIDRFTYTRLGYQQLPVEWRFAIVHVSPDELRLGNDRYPDDRVFRRSVE